MILNARQNSFLINLPQDFFNEEINEKYEQYYRNLLVPYRSISDFMASTIQGVSFPGFNSVLPQQIRPLGKRQESHSAIPIADQFTRELSITFKLTDGWLNYFIFLDNMLNYLDFSNINLQNTKNSLGNSLTVPQTPHVNHPFFSPIRLTILNNEGYAFASIIYNRPLLKGLTDLKLAYNAIRPQFTTFTATFQYFNFDIELEFE